MSSRRIVGVAQFSLPDGEGDLLAWRYEDELPPEHDHKGRSAVMENKLTEFRFWHGRGEQDCGGMFRFRNVSATLRALVCGSCHLRLAIPRATDTLMRLIIFGQSHGWHHSVFLTLQEWNHAFGVAFSREQLRAMARPK